MSDDSTRRRGLPLDLLQLSPAETTYLLVVASFASLLLGFVLGALP